MTDDAAGFTASLLVTDFLSLSDMPAFLLESDP